MEEYELLIKRALFNLKTADHLIYVTYPLVNDPKLITSIIGRLFSALDDTITAILNYDYLYKRINSIPDGLDDKLELFKKVIDKRYSFDRNILSLISELNKFVEFRNKSPIEFVRRENLVVCSPSYNTKAINFRKVKEYVNQSKMFIFNVARLLIKNGI